MDAPQQNPFDMNIPADVLIDNGRAAPPNAREYDELENLIDDEEIQVITEKHVCVFWSQRGADRLGVDASTQNKFDKTSKNYDACSSPDLPSEAALGMCNYDIVTPEDAEIYCPYYEAEHEFVLFETEKGKVTTTRILEFENMEMSREFKVVMNDGSEMTFQTSVEAFAKIRD